MVCDSSKIVEQFLKYLLMIKNWNEQEFILALTEFIATRISTNVSLLRMKVWTRAQVSDMYV
jgi:hypothetical protein